MTLLTNEQKRGLLDFVNHRVVYEGETAASRMVKATVQALRGDRYLRRAAHNLGLESAFDVMSEKNRGKAVIGHIGGASRQQQRKAA